MVKIITTQEITLVSPDFGKITVPISTRIMFKKVGDVITYYPENEEDIIIPKKDLIGKVKQSYQVRFSYSEIGYSFDVFKIVGSNRKLCRMEDTPNTPTWHYLNDDEPDNTISAGVEIQVVDSKGNIIASETNQKEGYDIFAVKNFPFSWENNDNSLEGKESTLFMQIYIASKALVLTE